MSEHQRVAEAEPAGSGAAGSNPEELLELLRRERASFLNYKRRVEQERASDRERSLKEVVLRLLPALDELDRALAQPPQDLESHPWAQGVALVHRRLIEAMRDLGVERFGTKGETFDPALHEAVLFESKPGVSERRIDSVIRPGYRFGEHLLRPAQVSVVGPAETPATDAVPKKHHKRASANHQAEIPK